MRTVTFVKPLSNRMISVEFADGLKGTFDVAPYIRSDFFKKLEDDDYFSKVRIFFGGVGWPEGQDLGPDTIAAELDCRE